MSLNVPVPKVGVTVQIRNAAGESMNAVVLKRGSDLPVPAAPSSSTLGSGGTLLDSTTYGYKITAVVDGTETRPSAEKTQLTGAAQGNDNTVTLDWTATPVAGATSYRVYGRTSGGPWGLLATVTGTTYTDTGAAVPGAAAPGSGGDHIGVYGPHDGVERIRVEKATALRQADRYYYWV